MFSCIYSFCFHLISRKYGVLTLFFPDFFDVLGYMDGQWESNDLEAFVFEMLKLEVVKKDGI